MCYESGVRNGYGLLLRIASVLVLAIGAVGYLLLMARVAIATATLTVIAAFIAFAVLNALAVLVIDLGAIRRALEKR